ncbi:lysophospholipid acyltransferase family protein [Gallaecimonas sp. GXIMD4217]|uniref:lysophospholipid acyltransferase family protein n=1 Tax=Gallaecimonas sp. GXIMD4217 TaxID=3131927 RepID=UPI00311B21D9
MALVLKRLNKAWRVLATGLAFSIFGIGGVLLSLTVFPYLNLRYKNVHERKLRARAIVSRSFRFFLEAMRLMGICTYEIDGEQRLNAEPCLVIANHPSLLDVVLLIAAMPKADCVVKEAIWHNPFMRGVVRATGYISNARRGEEMIEAARQTMAEGFSLVIFPEGTRTRPGQPLAMQRGAANLAVRTEFPLRPVLLDVTPTTLTKSEPWYRVPDRPFHLSARVLDDIDTRDFIDNSNGLPQAARRLTRYLEGFYEEKRKDDGKPRTGP